MRASVWVAAALALLAAAVLRFAPSYWMYVPALIHQTRHPTLPNQPVEWRTIAPENTAESSSKPNIVVIVVDDVGINDISFFGGGYHGGSLQTPHIDSIGRAGVSFTNGYAGHATCAPSRAALLTGKLATKLGFEYTPISDWGSYVLGQFFSAGPLRSQYHGERKGGKPWGYENMSLPFSEVTIPEALRGHGYRNLHLGKYHVGFFESAAIHRGFDETLGFGVIASYLESGDPKAVNCYLDDTFDNFIWANTRYGVRKDNGPLFQPDGRYLTDYLAAEAVRAMEANRQNPFFMYLALSSIHTPLSALKSDYDDVSQKHPDWSHCDKVYAAMIVAMDRGVGTVLQGISDLNLTDDTIVIFTSDNGGAGYINQRFINAPYRGWKASFFEGGLRTPFFMRWPRRVPASSTVSALASHTDIFPTVLAAAGVPITHEIDGVNLLPIVTRDPAENEDIPIDAIHDKLFWRSAEYKALRTGDWKLQISENPPKKWLFNMVSDPTERVNLAADASHQDVLLRMGRLLEQENAEQADSLWPSLSESPLLIDKIIFHDEYSAADGDEYIYWSN